MKQFKTTTYSFTNYLVQNTENYFEKMQNSNFCPSPKSLGAVDVTSMA